MAKAAVRSYVVGLLLLTYCLLLLPLFVEVLCLTLVFVFSTLCPSSFAITLMGFLTLTAFPMSCDSQCFVAVTHAAVSTTTEPQH